MGEAAQLLDRAPCASEFDPGPEPQRRPIGCEFCELQVQQLLHSRSLTVFAREGLWRAINVECGVFQCPIDCATRSLVFRVSRNLADFVARANRVGSG